jgi:hypothetical protein
MVIKIFVLSYLSTITYHYAVTGSLQSFVIYKYFCVP